jgi:hypothetical protein
MFQKPLHIFTPVWGAKNLALMRSALGRSLRWRHNYESVKNAKWHLVSTPQDAQAAKDAALEILPQAQIDILVDPRLGEGINHGEPLAAAVMKLMKICIDDDAPCLMATTDFVYGDGTIQAMINLGNRPGICVGMAHIRVVPEFLNEMNAHSEAWTNATLMDFAWKHAHPTWNYTERSCNPTMSYHCGTTWEWLPTGEAAVEHHMPSPFLVNFIAKDLVVWQNKGKPGFGFWDHDWPTFLLEDQRLRWIGSSDAAFMAEVTDATANCGELMPRNALDPDAFFKDAYHCKIQHQFVTIFRGES